MTHTTEPGLTELLHAQVPFAETLGLRAVAADPAEVTAVCDWQPGRCTVADVLHGGYLMAVADTVGATCTALNLPPGATTTTVESKTNFFRPVTEGTVTVSSSPIHVGSTVIVVQTDTTNGGRLVARTTQTQTVRNP